MAVWVTINDAPERQLPPGVEIPGTPADSNGPSINTVVREQLRLKLEQQRDQEEVLVIDHIDRPPEN